MTTLSCGNVGRAPRVIAAPCTLTRFRERVLVPGDATRRHRGQLAPRGCREKVIRRLSVHGWANPGRNSVTQGTDPEPSVSADVERADALTHAATSPRLRRAPKP
ncbi:hypothetical protein GCM10010384_28150 [Streptomyces djakartensis]|uniref:Uncharacterized protein n=1 Tax=Streptomyces djakartensis TaxID=68193 RepID=A0ABQ2ZQE7_9ACTN|nr:hypothetical protein GCM10010384_28150 [Streptomyces djakartensis]